MDAVASTFIKPVQNLIDIVRLSLIFVIAIIPITICYFTQGKKVFGHINKTYDFLCTIPGGRFLFSNLCVWSFTTFSGSIRSTVTKVSPTGAEAFMDDRPWLRNPFSSLHAVALCNLGELVSGLAVLSATQAEKGLRAIPNRIEMEYMKKARGRITASTTIDLPKKDGPYKVTVEFRDSKGEEVCRGYITWVVSVKPKSQ
eukprot:CAMPEP_0206253888 /NCGR_PEP_ID=MMETSP0047_2-20121206/23396_1 /ASSEMBLY_ACC=CAM_ASM_000192 /TAXON_ID=195065 /ORGANISM="Chroomonas mesostigmatica_cf, Strain CCMP1168" /LENGTH=199 /DNA_ID=CAMNT_0053680135 /DNA_START=36 /DNA_END=635 /DNA_ORIENTATION=+